MLEATGRLSEQRLAEIDFVLELIRYTSLTIGTSIVMHVFVTIVGLHGLRRWIVAIFAPTACLAALVLTFGLNWLSPNSTFSIGSILTLFPVHFAIAFTAVTISSNLTARKLGLGLPKGIGTHINYPGHAK